MGYIYEDELKEILPEIMSDWIDKDDESWEWIFQEIEQKCYPGTRLSKKDKKKDKKKWKKKLRDDVDELQYFRHNEYEVKVNGIATKVNELSNKVSKLNDICNAHTVRLDRMDQDITAAKSMAQTAKQRTEVDYTKCSKEKSDADVVQDIYNRMVGRGATKEELDTFRNLIQKYDALDKKEIPVIKKTCVTCKYESTLAFEQPCVNCCHNSVFYNGNIKGTDKWEAKDNA